MQIQFEPSGTHIKKGFLNIRMDFLNSGIPFLCHFMKVNSETLKAELESYINNQFDSNICNALYNNITSGTIDYEAMRDILKTRLGFGIEINTNRNLLGEYVLSELLIGEPTDDGVADTANITFQGLVIAL